MSEFYPEEHKCAVCGERNKYCMIASTNTFGGGQDLDLRPPGERLKAVHGF